MTNFGFIPDPEHVEAAKLSVPATSTPDNPKGAVGRPAEPPSQASDFTSATEGAAPPSAAPAPANAAMANFGFKPDSEIEIMSKKLQAIGINKERSDKIAEAAARKKYANSIPAFPSEASDLEDQQREIETGQGLKGAGLAAGIVGGEVAGGAFAMMKAAKVAQQLRAINAARQAAGVAKLADSLETLSDSRIARILKDDADAEIPGAAKDGGPSWKGPGKQGPVEQDMTAEELAAANAAARKSSVALLKNPTFWKTVGIGTAAAAGGPAWQMMSGVYHARRTAQFLAHIFGE